MNEEQRKTEVEKFMNYFVYINRPGADKLLEWLEQIGFFTAPAYAVDTIAVVALLHDVCKADAYKVEKKNQKQKDGSWQQVDTYGYTNNFPVGHGEKSIIQIMRFMYLTEEEVLAIRWHMGAFDNAVKGGSYDMNYAFAQSRLAAMLHIADMMATHLDERTEANE